MTRSTEKPMPVPPEGLLQARLAHLNMVQAIIGRVASYSATVKNFNLTIAAALIAVAFDKELPVLLMAGMGVTIVFLLLDAYYLGLERCFRDLYNDIAGRPFDEALKLNIQHRPVDIRKIAGATTSISVWGYYTPLLVGLAILAYLACNVAVESSSEKYPQAAKPTSISRPVTPAGERDGSLNPPSKSGVPVAAKAGP